MVYCDLAQNIMGMGGIGGDSFLREGLAPTPWLLASNSRSDLGQRIADRLWANRKILKWLGEKVGKWHVQTERTRYLA